MVLLELRRQGLELLLVSNLSIDAGGYLLRYVDNQYRGRVFATMESLTWSTMMLSMTAAGIASTQYSPRTIGAVAGVLSSCTAIFWGWANWTGRLRQPEPVGIDAREVEVHGDPVG